MKIAIIGSGISGLSAAHHLAPHHQSGRVRISLFEADSRIGGHANTVEVESERGTEQVDTGFIVFNRRNYPVFTSMLEELEVTSRPSNMSFSVSDGSGFEFTGRNLAGVFADRRNLLRPGFLKMLAEVPVFQRRMRQLVESEAEITLDEFLAREGFSTLLRERVVVPMVASVWSAGDEAMSKFPARFLARFLDNHGLLNLADRPQWRTIDGGSRSYVERLIEPFKDRVFTGQPIEMVRRIPGGVTVKTSGRPAERFDQVIIATHAPETLEMLVEADRFERRFLGCFPYQRNEAVLHSDPAVMPTRRAAWASWNYRIGASSKNLTALSYDMNRLQSLECEKRFFVSLNMSPMIDPELVHGRFSYDHPVFTPDGVAAQEDWAKVSGRGGVHFAGAWLKNGFHEDGAATGKRAAEAVLSRAVADPGLAMTA
ncbi:MAG TPA: FAD-dependent oxidoreductase [Solirubrobacterales bacterium]|nr:FAD-dependent oxidoreductase [Solirubrobacterales bacterium]HNG57720.1 FAD-dependent oxidoreductase [Solirubrobacterales bacterium]